MAGETIIQKLEVKDLRFPTSLQHDGSDAMHVDPDYSCAYVTLHTSSGEKGYGLTFTLGKGTEVVIAGINALKELVEGAKLNDIYNHFGKYWKSLTSHSQLRWIGPEKGVMHLATAAVINALWDLWAKIEGKPLWKLLVDMSPEKLVSTIDFTYITDVITQEEAIKMLQDKKSTAKERTEKLMVSGYPAYTTQVGWLGYSSDKVESLCRKYMSEGFTAFKIKVGQSLEDDKRRCKLVRNVIGYKNELMVDANQKWDVDEAIKWMKELAEFKPLWIEEPTSPDDILGHATIARALESDGIKVATGEMCANRVMFKQLFQAKAIHYCQIDSCRVAGVNELLSIYLMANKFSVKVCPHAGGIGLCEMVQHLQMWDFISLSGDMEGKWIEYVDQQHEHFKDPVSIIKAAYQVPKVPGYSSEIHSSTIDNNIYPNGKVWQELFANGTYKL